jgi:hypothetical protein
MEKGTPSRIIIREDYHGCAAGVNEIVIFQELIAQERKGAGGYRSAAGLDRTC